MEIGNNFWFHPFHPIDYIKMHSSRFTPGTLSSDSTGSDDGAPPPAEKVPKLFSNYRKKRPLGDNLSISSQLAKYFEMYKVNEGLDRK